MTEIEKAAPAPITEAARTRFQAEQVAVIRDTVAKDCSEAELHMFLEIAVRHGLDPFLGEIYAAKMGGQDGAGGRVTIMVPRDGFLAVAQRSGELESLDGDVVRVNDEFKVSRRPDGSREVEHSYSKDRGEIAGAWAIVKRRDRTPMFFYAPIEEYLPTSEKKLKYSPWSRQASAMILKCAESNALRKAFSITGVAGAEEMQKQMIEGPTGSPEPETEWGEDPTVAEMVKAYFDRVNELQPGAYKPAKVRVMLRGLDDDERRRLVESLGEEIEALGGSVPDPPDFDEDENVTDAEVVEEVEDEPEEAAQTA